MSDFIPTSDAEFAHWLENFVTYLVNSPEAPPLGDAGKAALCQALLKWNRAYGASLVAQAAITDALIARKRSAGVVDALMSAPVASPEQAARPIKCADIAAASAGAPLGIISSRPRRKAPLGGC
jgi:hypothetical protein